MRIYGVLLKISVLTRYFFPKIKGKTVKVGYGAEIRIYELYKNMAKKGAEVHIFVPSVNPNAPFSLSQIYGGYEYFEGLHIHRLPSIPFWLLTRLPSITRTINAIISSSDVIISEFHPFYFTGLEGLVARCINGSPVILDAHDIAGSKSHDIAVSKLILYPFFKKNEELCYKLCDGLVICSEEAKRYAQKITNKEICVVSNGVDTKRYPNTNKENIEKTKKKFDIKNEIIIGFSGSLTAQNGVDYLIKAAPDIFSKNPGTKILVVGNGSDESNLKKLAKQLGVSDKVIFTGKVGYEEIPNYLAAMDICVAPFPKGSEFTTNFPLKLIEYMSAGKPVVVTDGNVLRRIIKESNGGVVAASEDSKLLAKAINSLVEDKKYRRKLGENGRIYSKDYDWQKSSAKMLEFIETIATKRR